MEIIRTDAAPPPQGHYSQAITHGGLVFVSMQLPGSPDRPVQPTTSIEEQAESALLNVQAILQAANSDLSRAVLVTIYLASISDWGQVNVVYERLLGDHKPARGVVPTGALHRGFGIGIMAVAAIYDQAS
ncbi:MAG: Rid family hydrolase [Gemmatimonadota bacterium]|nr:Rid family hydrolase [Gemmatimonadota bacterium]